MPIRKPRNNADECHCAETRRDGAFRAICFVAPLARGACHGRRIASRISSREASVAATRDLFRGSLDTRMTRFLRHAGLAAVSLAAIVLSALYWPQRSVAYAVSFVTAYASLLCLTVTLGLGPWHAMRRRRMPTSSYLRRDFGIWTALLAMVHVGFGLFVHMHGNVWLYFFRASPDQGFPWPRIDPFGLTNDLGLAATLLLLVLLALSNNWSLKRLGAVRWKAWQRSSYWTAAAIALHAAIYQLLEHRTWAWLLACWALFALIAGLQWAARRPAPA
ncbi:MAG: hypothetical protein E6H53_01800 [Betaproteobacteria bacterium]|nr:MAG: hypothetical protein E6H53_01800 [Betaproteobacteria bacterium]